MLTVWGTVKDLVGEDQPSYVRKLGYEIMHALIDGQYDRLGSLRMGTAPCAPPTSRALECLWSC